GAVHGPKDEARDQEIDGAGYAAVAQAGYGESRDHDELADRDVDDARHGVEDDEAESHEGVDGPVREALEEEDQRDVEQTASAYGRRGKGQALVARPFPSSETRKWPSAGQCPVAVYDLDDDERPGVEAE